MNLGRIRMFIHKLDPPKEAWGHEYEVLVHETFEEGLISDVKPDEYYGHYIDEYISNINLDDEVVNIPELDSYVAGDVIEVLADFHEETSQDSYTQEWDSEVWFENVKHRKLTKEQIPLFTGEHIEPELIPLDKKTK